MLICNNKGEYIIMKRRALEGVYLLAYFEKQNKYDYDTYKDMIIEVVDNREDISEARDIFDIYYKQSLCFLNRCIPWYRLKTPLRNTIAYFEKYSNNKYEINNYADEYFKKIEIEYNQKKIRNEEHLLDGEKYIRIYDFEFDENNQVQLYMSIVTNSIIEYDNTMLSEDNNKKGYYRPYFVEFISDYINKEDFKRLEIDINSEDSQWKKINFVEGEYKGNNPCIPGTFIFSASPLKIDKRKIEITNCKIPDKVKNFNLDLRSIRDNVFNSERKKELNNKLKEISDDIHCVDIEINTINDKITLIDNNTDKTEDMFISFGNEVFERNQNKLLKSKIDDLLKQKEIYQENYNQLSVKMEEMQDVINNNDIETMENVDNNSDSTNILWLLEADRKRISRDIHDTVVQNLTALIHKQEFAIQIADRDLNRAKIEMNNVKGIVKESINELRNIIYQLRPMELDDLGFNEALMNLLDKLDDSHKDIIMHYTIDCTDDISHVVCMSTLRIINELTSNSFKHADCNNIYIDIATDDNKLTISYKDDGCGFDFEQIGKVKSNNTGYGIRMLVERVNLLRGSINYNKDEKEFVINIPLK